MKLQEILNEAQGNKLVNLRRKEAASLSKKLKSHFEKKLGFKINARALKEKNVNPRIELSVKDWDDEFPTEFRDALMRRFGINPSAQHPSIKPKLITFKLSVWKRIMGIKDTDQSAASD